MLKLFGSTSPRLCRGVVIIALVSAALSTLSQSQNFTVRGVVKGASTPISYALVTLVQMSDTTYKVSTVTDATGYYALNVVTGVESSHALPSEFAIGQNYPNPFATSTSIAYSLSNHRW